MKEAVGYAVYAGEDCMVATISPTEVGAHVNFLIIVPRIMALDQWTDAYIKQMFDRLTVGSKYKCVQVCINPAQDPGHD